MNKPFIQLLTAAVVLKSVVLGQGPVGAATNIVINHPNEIVDIATGSANAIWNRITSRWRPAPASAQEPPKKVPEIKKKDGGQ